MNPYYHIREDEYQKEHEEHIEKMLDELFKGLVLPPKDEEKEE